MTGVENMDFVLLQKIIPEEIWGIVIANLLKKSPSDFESLSNSSPFFRNLLAPKRTVFLFDKALEVVGSTVWKKHGLEGLPIRDLIKYREVCSNWNSAVDKLISEMFQVFEKGYSGYDTRCLMNNSFQYFGRRFAQKCMDHFRTTHPIGLSQPFGRSPFILGDVTINIRETPHGYQPAAYDDSMNTLISAYGGHIQNFTIDVQRSSEFFNNLSWLRRWLRKTPNLKKLSVHCEKSWSRSCVVEHDEHDQTFKLNRLECLNTRDLPTSVFNLLIRQNSHVSSLIMKNCKDDYDFFTFPLPNLKKLEMKYCSAQLLITLGFPEVQWPLESLTLAFDNGDNVGCIRLLKLIQNKFANTLISLDLSLIAADVDVEGQVWQAFKTSRLDLPKLKKIKLDVCANLTCLDFLLPMKNTLEEISINGGREFPLTFQNLARNEVTVQFIGFEGKMLESNIWEIFTKLKKVEITPRWDRVNGSQHWSYSREKWVRRGMSN